MWKYKKFPGAVRVILSFVFVFCTIGLLSNSGSSDSNAPAPPSENTAAEAPVTDKTEKPEAAETPASEEESVTAAAEKTPVSDEPKDSSQDTQQKTSNLLVYSTYNDISVSFEGFIDFSLDQKEADFLKQHPELFPAGSEADCEEYTDYEIDYKHIAKSIQTMKLITSISQRVPPLMGISLYM